MKGSEGGSVEDLKSLSVITGSKKLEIDHRKEDAKRTVLQIFEMK